MKTKVFLSHPFSDNPELRLKQVDYICRNLSDEILPISPLHLFSFEDDDSRREQILKVCFDLIDMCEKVFIYDYGKLSAGQEKELFYCAKNNIEYEFKLAEKRLINEGWI